MTNDTTADVTTLFQERCKIYSDLYNNIIPTRMPVSSPILPQVVTEYYGLSPIDFQYDSTLILPYYDKLLGEVYCDNFPFFPPLLTTRNAAPYQLIASQSFVMGSKGFVQHPEVTGMYEDEYEQLINSPIDFIVGTAIGRQHKNLDISDPVKMALTINRLKNWQNNEMMPFIQPMIEMIQKYGLYPGAPSGSATLSSAPFDFLTDYLRGFSEICKDIRRNPGKIKEALEVLTPLCFQWGLPALAHPEGSVTHALHMPTYLREKDFVELWLPSFKRIMEQYAARNIRSFVYCETNWMRYLDIILSEFPANTQLCFEKGDPKLIKEKLGKKFIISSMFPLEYIKMLPKNKMLDEAKEFFDIVLPGGGYTFSNPDRFPLMCSDINMDNYIAIMNFMHEYCVYDNAGESYGMSLNSEKFTIDQSLEKPIKSKYLFDWSEFKKTYPLAPDFAQKKFEALDKGIWKFYLELLT